MAEKDVATIDKETDARGRPCKYESHVEPYLDKIFEWLKAGYTDISICEQLGIHQNTWMRYKDKYSILGDLYARARTHRNALVMNKMFQKATGEKVSLIKQKTTKDGEIVDLVEEQYIPPDVNAADLFLRNNDPEYKSAKADISGQNITVNFQLDDWEKKRKEILDEIKRLELQSAVDVEAIPVEE